MIQRIQSIWLLLSSLSLVGLFFLPYMMYSNPVDLGRSIFVTGVKPPSGVEPSFLMMTIVAVILTLIPIFIIFQFKNRKLQLKLILVQVILVCLFAIWMWITADGLRDVKESGIHIGNIGIGYFTLPLSILFISFAIRGIRNDEKLIKSADRLR
ncbi:DUF4293 domain-containing protein [Sphingobacterium kyonggiense]